MRIWHIALALFMFNALLSGINTAGVFPEHIQDQGLQVQESKVMSLGENATGNVTTAGDLSSDYSGLGILVRGAQVIWGALKGTVYVRGWLIEYGVASVWANLLQTGLILIYGAGAVQWWLNRPFKQMA